MVTKIVWMRNKEAGQKIGNKQKIQKVNKQKYNKYLSKLMSEKIPYEKFKKKFGTSYISLIKKGRTNRWEIDSERKKKKDLIPPKKYALQVKSFTSKKAKKWLKTADSDIHKIRKRK